MCLSIHQVKFRRDGLVEESEREREERIYKSVKGEAKKREREKGFFYYGFEMFAIKGPPLLAAAIFVCS